MAGAAEIQQCRIMRRISDLKGMGCYCCSLCYLQQSTLNEGRVSMAELNQVSHPLFIKWSECFMILKLK